MRHVTISKILCSVQCALLDNVTPNLRAVFVKFKDDVISLTFFYDKQPSEDEAELASLADTEVIADFPSPEYQVNCQIVIHPYPLKLPKEGKYAYLRYEGKSV